MLQNGSRSPSFWVPVVKTKYDEVDGTGNADKGASPRQRLGPCRTDLREMESSPIQTQLPFPTSSERRAAASERKAAFLESRRERIAAGLAKVDATRCLREEQMERLRAKGRNVQLRLETAHAERQQRLQTTMEKCSERVARAKAVAARLRQQQNEAKDVIMQKYVERLQGGAIRRSQHLRHRSELCVRSIDKKQGKNSRFATAATVIQRWWRRQMLNRAAAAFITAVPRTLVRILRGQHLEKLTFTLSQQLVSLPEVTKATQTLMYHLSKICPDIAVLDCKNSRDARLLLSCVVTTLFPSLVLEQQGPVEQELIGSANRLLFSFGSIVGLRKSQNWSRLMLFTANWLHFKRAFTAWKQQDAARLLSNFRDHWLQLVALKNTIMSNGKGENAETQSEWLPNIERQQQDILARIRQIAGQAGVNDFLAGLSLRESQPTQVNSSPVETVIEQPSGSDKKSGQSAPTGNSSSASGESDASPPSSGGNDVNQSSSPQDSGSNSGGNGGDNNSPSRSPSLPDGANSNALDVVSLAQNLELAHEVVMNENFSLKKAQHKPGSLIENVEKQMKAAFWAILQQEVEQDPPVFDQVLRLLAEVKENLFATIHSERETSLHREIEGRLDMDLVKQQLDNGVLDIKALALHVVSLMARACAPVRDEQIAGLKASLEADQLDVAGMFRSILDVLSEMRLDMANFQLQTARPYLLQHSARYEREKFQELFPNAPGDGLNNTAQWLSKAQQNLAVSSGADQVSPLAILYQAFVDMVTQPMPEPLPETWWLDSERLSQISTQLEICGLLQTMAVLAGGALGHRLANNADFLTNLLSNLNAILSDSLARSQTISDIQENLVVATSSAADFFRPTVGLPVLTEQEKTTLEATVRQAFAKDNPVRNLLSRRIAGCVYQAVSKPVNGQPLEIPSGLQLVEKELRSAVTSFARLSSYNRKVFGPMYSHLLQTLLRS